MIRNILLVGVAMLGTTALAQNPIRTTIEVEMNDGQVQKFFSDDGVDFSFLGGEGPVVLPVDLGLPSGIMWANMNIGATSPEDYGWYLAWGETTPQESNRYDWESYKWCNGSNTTLTKYCLDSSNGTVDNKTVLDPDDDAAHVSLGSDWRMPTRDEIDELCTYCYWTWTTLNGVNGCKVESMTNGNSIFLPAAGFRGSGDISSVGTTGFYWSSSLRQYVGLSAYYFYFRSDNWYWNTTANRNYGLSVRAVCQ